MVWFCRAYGLLADNRGLRHVLLRQRGHDALDVGPFLFDQFAVCLPRRLDEEIAVVAGMPGPDQGIGFLVQVAIARRELIAERMQNPEVDLVGAVRVCRMPLRLDVRGIVVQQVEHIMALVLVGADDPGVDRHRVGHQGVGAHAFLQAEILAGVPGIDRVDLGFEALAVAARCGGAGKPDGLGRRAFFVPRNRRVGGRLFACPPIHGRFRVGRR